MAPDLLGVPVVLGANLMNKYLANARFIFLYAVISAVVVGIVMTYSWVVDLAWFQTALALTGGLLGAWATLFTLLEIRRIARKARGQAEEPINEADLYVPKTVVVLPPTGDPCPHHEDYPESAGFSEEQLVFRTPDRTPLIEDFLDRRAAKKQQAAR